MEVFCPPAPALITVVHESVSVEPTHTLFLSGAVNRSIVALASSPSSAGDSDTGSLILGLLCLKASSGLRVMGNQRPFPAHPAQGHRPAYAKGHCVRRALALLVLLAPPCCPLVDLPGHTWASGKAPPPLALELLTPQCLAPATGS